MGTFVEEIKRNEARGDKEVAGFSGAVRSLDSLALEVGDIFKFPAEYRVFSQVIGNNTAEYIMIELLNEDGTPRNLAKPFYPSTFTKSRQAYNKDMTPIMGMRPHTEGSAAELYRKHQSVQAGMDALKGLTVKITKIAIVQTIRYGTTQLAEVQIPTIDIIKNADGSDYVAE